MASILDTLPHGGALFAGRVGAVPLPDGRALLVRAGSSAVVEEAIEPPDNQAPAPDESLPTRRPAYLDLAPLFSAPAVAEAPPFGEMWRRRDEPDDFIRQDPYTGGMIRVAQAVRANPYALALSYRLRFGDASDPEVAYQLKKVVQGIADAAQMLGLPVVAGELDDGDAHVSVLGHGVRPRPVAWSEGDAVVVVGRMTNDLSGSVALGRVRSFPPPIDLIVEGRVLEVIRQADARCAVGIERGGLLVTLARCARQLGARITIPDAWRALDLAAVLYGEAQSRFLVSLAEADIPKLIELAEPLGIPVQPLGTAGGGRLAVDGLLDIDLKELE